MALIHLFRLKKLLAAIISIMLILSACSAPDEKASADPKGESASVKTTNIEGARSVLRTEEIFDAKKYEGQLSIRFFLMEGDGKTGDSIFLRTPDGVTMLIDSGLQESVPQVVDYLKKLGVKKLDYIVATHYHQDHIGGFPEIINNFEIGKAYIPDLSYNSSPNTRFKDAMSLKNIKTEFLREGDSFQLGKEIKVDVLNPEPKIVIPDGIIPEKTDAFVNNKSIVMKMTYKQKTFLFTGDIYRERELVLTEQMKDMLNADVLKAPHHGADTSSSKAFIDAVSPEHTIFTSNKSFSKNEYDNYRKAGSKVYITGVDGNILLTSDGININVVTEKDRIGSYLN